MYYDGLAPDQMEKVKACKAKCSPAEMCDGRSRLGVESTATAMQGQSERTPHELRRPEGPQAPGETEGR